MQTTRALTIVALLTGFLVACGDMPTSVPAPDSPALRFDGGGAIGSGSGVIVTSDSTLTISEVPEDDEGGETEERGGGAIGSGS